MSVPSASLTRSRRERLAAWLVTGPLGHLYSVTADLTVFATGLLRQRLSRRP